MVRYFTLFDDLVREQIKIYGIDIIVYAKENDKSIGPVMHLVIQRFHLNWQFFLSLYLKTFDCLIMD